MSKYWFKAKRYGWGTGLPLTWQGWLFTILLVVLILIAAFVDGICSSTIELKAVLRFVLDTLLLSLVWLICIKDKIEGGLKWRWGDKN